MVPHSLDLLNVRLNIPLICAENRIAVEWDMPADHFEYDLFIVLYVMQVGRDHTINSLFLRLKLKV